MPFVSVSKMEDSTKGSKGVATAVAEKPAKRRKKSTPGPELQRPGFGPFNLAKGADVDHLITDWARAILTLENEDWIALDLETSGLNPYKDYIAVVGLYGPKSKAACVLHTPVGDIPQQLIDWLSQPKRKFVTQNGVLFDVLFLHEAGVRVFDPEWYDTRIGEQVITLTNRSGVRNNLQTIVKRRLNVDISKDVDHRDWLADVLTDQQIRYVAEDISFLPKIREAQLAKADDYEDRPHPHYKTTLRDALAFEHKLVPTVVRMQLNGLPIDLDALEQYYQDQIKEAAAASTRLDARFGEINWSSHVQVKRAFKETYDVDLLSTQEDTLKEVRDLMTGTDVEDAIDDLITYKHASKRSGMYNHTFIEKYVRDGWVHGNFSQCGTDTGRFSSSNPNLQQIPKNKGEKHGKGARHIFGNHPEYDIVSADYSQIEFRVAVNEAGDAAAIELLKNSKYDIHTLVASQVFGVEPSDVTKDQRQLSKAMSFTLLFGGGAALLSHYAKSQGADLPLSRAKPMVQAFFNQFDGLNRMRQRAYMIADAKRPFTVYQPTGLRRVLVPNQDLRATLILNNWVQGTAAAGLKMALLEAQRRGLDRRIGAVVHDEIVAAVPKRESQAFAAELKECMLRGMENVCEDVPVAVEVSIGSTWG